MHRFNWAVTYGADGNDINETIVERSCVCVPKRERERGREGRV